jgi:hypothetical protein
MFSQWKNDFISIMPICQYQMITKYRNSTDLTRNLEKNISKSNHFIWYSFGIFNFHIESYLIDIESIWIGILSFFVLIFWYPPWLTESRYFKFSHCQNLKSISILSRSQSSMRINFGEAEESSSTFQITFLNQKYVLLFQ